MAAGCWGLRAAWVLPICGPPIPNGLLLLRGARIVRLAKATRSELRTVGRLVDLGDAAILPGLINAHCHLEFAPATRPATGFVDWLGQMVASRQKISAAQSSKNWLDGSVELLQSGTTTVANIESRGENLPELWQQTPLRVHSFFEVTNVLSGASAREVLEPRLKAVLKWKNPRGKNGLSPHSVFAATPELFRECARASTGHRLPVTTHLCESKEEQQMFDSASGKLFEWLGAKVPTTASSPVSILKKAGLLSPRFLAVHLNYPTASDLAQLARHRCSVVHCPRSHAFFGHDRFPFERIKRAGLNVCLGTDSRASLRPSRNQSLPLNLFEEMRLFARRHPISPRQLLAMATQHGARALGLEKVAGDLLPGKKADLTVVAVHGRQVEEQVVDQTTTVLASLIDGQWGWNPEQLTAKKFSPIH